MTTNATKRAETSDRRAPVMLQGATVTETFRDALFDASNRAGITPNEFVLQAAAEKLKRSGRAFTGLFRSGDLSELNGGMGL